MTPATHRYRVGLLMEGEHWPAWQVAALRRVLALGIVELIVAIHAHAPDRRRTRDTNAALPPDPRWPISVSPELGAVPRRALAHVVEAGLDEYALDLILSTSICPAAHALAGEVPAGVWALHVDGGDTECLGALLRAQSTIPAQLLRLSPELDQAWVLDEGHFRNEAFSPALTRARVLYGCAGWPARRLRAWRLQGERALTGRAITLEARPRRSRLARALLPARQLVSLLARARENCYDEAWAVGLSAQPIESFLDQPNPALAWLETPSDEEFHADPFGIETRDGPVLLAEGFDYGHRVGRIDVLKPAAEGTAEVTRNVLPRPCHLSYPYLIAAHGEIFCVPETHQARRIDLYRGTPFPAQWTFEATLVDDFAGVDATVFHHDGRWWLLCGTHDDEPDAKLYGFFADALTGPWTAHPLNPLKCDPRSSRPAGTPFMHAGVLYRPSQDCSTTYGGAVVINQILELSPSAFAESPAARIAPDPNGPYPDGLHTLAAVGRMTAIDGKRLTFSLAQLLRAGWHFVGRLRAHRAGSAAALGHETP